MLKNAHLTDEEVAVCAEAIADGNYASLDADLREHLITCDECAAEVLCVTDILVGQGLKHKGKRVDFKPWIVIASGIAAVGLILLVVSGVLTKVANLEHNEVAANLNPETLVESADSVKPTNSSSNDNLLEVSEQFAEQPKPNEPEAQGKPKSAVGASYVPDATLDALFQNYTQAYRGEDIIVISKGVVKLSETDSIKWSNPLKEELFVEFFNNKGDRIISLTQKESGMLIPELSNGLYYWKLINQDFDLLFVGKILVD